MVAFPHRVPWWIGLQDFWKKDFGVNLNWFMEGTFRSEVDVAERPLNFQIPGHLPMAIVSNLTPPCKNYSAKWTDIMINPPHFFKNCLFCLSGQLVRLYLLGPGSTLFVSAPVLGNTVWVIRTNAIQEESKHKLVEVMLSTKWIDFGVFIAGLRCV